MSMMIFYVTISFHSAAGRDSQIFSSNVASGKAVLTFTLVVFTLLAALIDSSKRTRCKSTNVMKLLQ